MPDEQVMSVVRRLSSRHPLTHGDVDALCDIPYVTRTHDASAYLVREGEPSRDVCSFVLSGLALGQKSTSAGARQIISIHMAGDFLDTQHLFLERADHNVQALTRLETIDFSRRALKRVLLERPGIVQAMWIDALIDASICREWIVNVGARRGISRVAHLLCELAVRFERAGLIRDGVFEVPLTQEQIGDAVGLTPVHVNRSLKLLAAEGLIQRDRRKVSLSSWTRLREVADFSALYLHETTAPAE
ncbi:transcriptional regulator [Azorhizobium oxalatiphilum]|uniref:Transcriptional regulator n=1 Tax=Azorhizobium oxalatiphilum TaxID=980631 RepID=A0A917FHV3_9HYPH|nr:Crp/Fnr family transcriptional regulator [Azorhizobium oxalatiphilum]GGF82560.1 transcriptional regulator [Azorhizobium oxalatiphilum]